MQPLTREDDFNAVSNVTVDAIEKHVDAFGVTGYEAGGAKRGVYPIQIITAY